MQPSCVKLISRRFAVASFHTTATWVRPPDPFSLRLFSFYVNKRSVYELLIRNKAAKGCAKPIRIKQNLERHKPRQVKLLSFQHFLLKGHLRQVLPKKLQMIPRRCSNSDLKPVVTPNENHFLCSNGCGRSYKLASSLTRHLNLECGKPKKFWCELCPKSYTRKESLKFHINEKHTTSKSSLNCL